MRTKRPTVEGDRDETFVIFRGPAWRVNGNLKTSSQVEKDLIFCLLLYKYLLEAAFAWYSITNVHEKVSFWNVQNDSCYHTFCHCYQHLAKNINFLEHEHWKTSQQFRWLLFEWLALLIKFAELKYRVKVMALAFDLFITDWWRLTLVLYEQACVCIAYCVQPNLWKRLLP